MIRLEENMLVSCIDLDSDFCSAKLWGAFRLDDQANSVSVCLHVCGADLNCDILTSLPRSASD